MTAFRFYSQPTNPEASTTSLYIVLTLNVADMHQYIYRSDHYMNQHGSGCAEQLLRTQKSSIERLYANAKTHAFLIFQLISQPPLFNFP